MNRFIRALTLVSLIGSLVIAPVKALGVEINACTPAPGADLTNCDLGGLDLSNADLSGANLTDAYLKNVNLSNANLSDAVLTGADLTRTNLVSADLTGIRSGRIVGEPLLLPNNYKTIQGFILGPSVNLEGVNLPFAELQSLNLSDVNFRNAYLRGVNFERTNLSGSNFENANLTTVNFISSSLINASLQNAVLAGATLWDTNLSGANISNTSFDTEYAYGIGNNGQLFGGIASSDLVGTPASCPKDYRLVNGYLVGPGAKLSNSNLSDQDLTGMNLYGANLTRANLSNANLSGANLTRAGLRDAYLFGANLTRATLKQTDVGGADFAETNLFEISGKDLYNNMINLPPKWNLVRGILFGPTAIIQDVATSFIDFEDLSSATLRGVSLSNILGTNRKLPPGFKILNGKLFGPNTIVQSGIVTDEDLSEVDFYGAKVRGLIGTPQLLPENWQIINGVLIGPGADLSDVDFTDRDLSYLNLDEVNLSSATISRTQFEGASLLSARGTKLNGTPASLPAGWKVSKGFLLGPTANMSNLDLSGVNLADVDLSLANLSGVSSKAITGSPLALPEGWMLSGGTLVGPGANLESSVIAGADLNGVDLRGAKLTSIQTTGLTGTPVGLPDGWALANGTLVGPGVNIFGATLEGADLSSVDLTGIRSGGLTGTPSLLPENWSLMCGFLLGPGANLMSSTLTNCDLSNVNLVDAHFESARITGVTFQNSNLSGANFSGATLSEVNFSSTNLERTDFPGIDFRSVRLDNSSLRFSYLGGSNFSNLRVTGADMSYSYLGTANLSNTEFDEVSFAFAYLKSVNIRNTSFKHCNLENSLFINAGLSNTMSSDNFGIPNVLPNASFMYNGTLIGPYANLQGANLAGINLSHKNLTAINLSSADLSASTLKDLHLGYANLTLTNFRNSDLSSINFEGANLDSTNFSEASLSSLNFLSATLDSTNFFSSVISDGNFSGAKLLGINLESATFGCSDLKWSVSSGIVGSPLQICDGYKIVNGILVAPFTNLNSTDFSGADLSFASMAGATVVNANFSGANLSHVSLKGASCSGANFIGADLSFSSVTGANVPGAKFSGALFDYLNSGGLTGTPSTLPTGYKLSAATILGPKVDLRDSSIAGANLAGISLSGALLKSVSSGSIIGTPTALPDKWRLVSGWLIGPDSNLSNATFTGLDLSGWDLSFANLSGVQSSNLRGSPLSLPQNWQLASGYLIGPGAQLSSRNLSDFDFSGLDLSAIKFSGSNLRGSTFNETNLSNADLSNADLSGAVFENTILTGGNMSDAILTNVRSTGVIGPISGLLPAKLANGYFVGRGVNLAGADLRDADLTGVNFHQANLTNANLSGALVEGSYFKGAILEGIVTGGLTGQLNGWDPLPTNWTYAAGWLIGPGANLSNHDFTDFYVCCVSLEGTDFTGANMTRAQWSSVIGNPVGLASGWGIRGNNLLGPTANLSGLYLSDLNLDGIDLANANLSRVQSQAITGSPTNLPVGWQIVKGYLVGPSANLMGADLSGATLRKANLEMADLSNATLTGIVSSELSGTPLALPTGWIMENGQLLMKQVLHPIPLIQKPVVGLPITGNAGAWDTGMILSYQWLLDGKPVSGATQAIIKPTPEMLGRNLSLRVTSTKAGVKTITEESASIKVNLGTIPKPVAKVTGSPKVGKILTASAKPALKVGTLKYQWLLDGKAIKGATSLTYKILKTQKGKKISVSVTQSAPGYLNTVTNSSSLKVG